MQQLDFDGKTKEEVSIEFIRQYEPPEGYFLGFSGGKDSIVLYDLAVQSGVKFQAYYSNTTIDPPELTKFIRKNYPDVTWLHPRKSFFKFIPQYGFPTKFARWCCNELKKKPSKHIKLRHRLMGIRAEESFKRKTRGQINEYSEQIIYSPIFDWLEWEVWEYIERKELHYCSLYDEGFDRLGCVICPFVCNPNSWKLKLYKERWPKHYQAFEKAMIELWDDREWWRQTRMRYAMLPEEFIENWYRGK